jgi:hypothetical protein
LLPNCTAVLAAEEPERQEFVSGGKHLDNPEKRRREFVSHLAGE